MRLKDHSKGVWKEIVGYLSLPAMITGFLVALALKVTIGF